MTPTAKFRGTPALGRPTTSSEINQGGATLTPVAHYFAWRPEFIEGFHAYWRVDCFVRKHPLSPKPMYLGKALVAALSARWPLRGANLVVGPHE